MKAFSAVLTLTAIASATASPAFFTFSNVRSERVASRGVEAASGQKVEAAKVLPSPETDVKSVKTPAVDHPGCVVWWFLAGCPLADVLGIDPFGIYPWKKFCTDYPDAFAELPQCADFQEDDDLRALAADDEELAADVDLMTDDISEDEIIDVIVQSIQDIENEVVAAAVAEVAEAAIKNVQTVKDEQNVVEAPQRSPSAEVKASVGTPKPVRAALILEKSDAKDVDAEPRTLTRKRRGVITEQTLAQMEADDAILYGTQVLRQPTGQRRPSYYAVGIPSQRREMRANGGGSATATGVIDEHPGCLQFWFIPGCPLGVLAVDPFASYPWAELCASYSMLAARAPQCQEAATRAYRHEGQHQQQRGDDADKGEIVYATPWRTVSIGGESKIPVATLNNSD